MARSKALIAGVAIVGLGMAGCAETGTVLDTKTKQGAALGALAGAVTGGLIGGHNGHGAGGALIGAASGALAGGLIGRYLDQQAKDLDAIPGAEVQRRDDSLLVNFSSQLSFDSDSSQLAAGGIDRLRQLARTLNNYPRSQVIVKGNADNTERSAQRLSEERADRVREILVSEGVSSSRIQAIGYGSSMPMATNGTAAGRSQNRRVEIEIRPDRDAEQGDQR
jgi:outer membrane protein OmpA-like peptidoglycan-associated protein